MPKKKDKFCQKYRRVDYSLWEKYLLLLNIFSHDVMYCMRVSAGSSALDLFECYDTRTESWQVKTSMLRARYRHGSVEANGLIYVCGGTVGNNVSGRVLNNCEVYDPNTQQ